MASKRENVRLSGVLRGNNLEASCVFTAVRVTHTDGDFDYAGPFGMVSVSTQLPEGVYELTFNDQTIALEFTAAGDWISAY